jgi:hypothetical protein
MTAQAAQWLRSRTQPSRSQVAVRLTDDRARLHDDRASRLLPSAEGPEGRGTRMADDPARQAARSGVRGPEASCWSTPASRQSPESSRWTAHRAGRAAELLVSPARILAEWRRGWANSRAAERPAVFKTDRANKGSCAWLASYVACEYEVAQASVIVLPPPTSECGAAWRQFARTVSRRLARRIRSMEAAHLLAAAGLSR